MSYRGARIVSWQGDGAEKVVGSIEDFVYTVLLIPEWRQRIIEYVGAQQ